MPQLSLPDALRYFFSPFAIYFYFSLYDPAAAKELAKDFGVLGSIAALVSGTTIYYLYRYLIYDDIVLSLYDLFRSQTQRSFIKGRYKTSPNFILGTRAANQILHQLSDNDSYSEQLKKRGRPMRAAGTHLMYQAGLTAWVFIGLSAYRMEMKSTILFTVISAIQLYTAIRMDIDYENEELLLVKSFQNELDQAAKSLGIERSEQLAHES